MIVDNTNPDQINELLLKGNMARERENSLFFIIHKQQKQRQNVNFRYY
jgi:hypothetical protein